MADVAVAGGGVVGLLTALLLARRGHQVVVLEPDPDPVSGTADDDFFGWHRPGVPQGMHGHVFRGRVARVLREEVPDVLDALLGQGIDRAGYDFGEGFEDDLALMSRRPVFEAAFRRVVRGEPRIELRTGVRVAGLEGADGGEIPRVIGLRTDAGERLAADLVVDCCGRRSAAPRWLAQVGSGLAVDHYQPCDLHYFARHYRLDPGATFPSTTFPAGDFTPYAIFLAMCEDNGTFCLAGGLSKADPCRSAFRDEAKFDEVMARLPCVVPWLEVGEPITEVHLMGGIANRRRSLMDADSAVVEGYVLVGDSSLYTNATLGQGIALGFWQAQALAHLSELIGRDNTRLVSELESWTSETLGPRYTGQVQIDEAMVGALRAGLAGAPMMPPGGEMAALAALRAMGDEHAASAFYRVDNLLSEVDEVLADDDLKGRVTTLLGSVPPGPAGPGPLPRHTFEALLT